MLKVGEYLKYFIFVVASLVTSFVYAQEVNESVFIDGADTKLYVEIKGKDDSKPVLLYLHGGPGNVVLGLLPFQLNVGKQLEEEFIVVYLHQRGVGKSPVTATQALTIDNHINDVTAVVEYVKHKYGRQKINLAGHSWGGMLAALYTEKYEKNINSLMFLATGMNVKELSFQSYLASLQWAEKTGNQVAITELNSIKLAPHSSANQLLLSKWSNQAGDGIIKNFNVGKFLKDNNVDDVYANWRSRSLEIRNALFEEFIEINLDKQLPRFKVPALFIAGKRDAIATVEMMKSDFDAYQGKKAFVVLEQSHHLLFIDEPDLMAKKMIAFIKST